MCTYTRTKKTWYLEFFTPPLQTLLGHNKGDSMWHAVSGGRSKGLFREEGKAVQDWIRVTHRDMPNATRLLFLHRDKTKTYELILQPSPLNIVGPQQEQGRRICSVWWSNDLSSTPLEKLQVALAWEALQKLG